MVKKVSERTYKEALDWMWEHLDIDTPIGPTDCPRIAKVIEAARLRRGGAPADGEVK